LLNSRQEKVVFVYPSEAKGGEERMFFDWRGGLTNFPYFVRI